MTDLTTAIHTYLTTAPTSAFHGLAVEMLDHWRGEENLLWRVECAGQEAVVKLYLDAGQARSRRQFDGHQGFAPLGLAPQPRWYDRYPTGLARQVLIYDWIPGAATDPGDAQALLQLADAMAQVHAGDPSQVLRFSPNPINLDYQWRMLRTSFTQIDRWLAETEVGDLRRTFAGLAGAATARINQALPLWESAPPTPVHGDLTLENAIPSVDGVALLDWELYGLGDPAREIAAFLHRSRTQIAPALSEQFRTRYLAQNDRPGLAARIRAYARILPLRDLCVLLDGLRAAQAKQERMTPEQRAFLHATTLAAWTEASRQLDAPPADLEPALASIMTAFDQGDTT